MPDEYGSYEAQRVKHLELIQGVVGRLGTDGFLVKGWALTVAGAFYGFAINKSNWRLAVLALLPAVAFWGLDAYFLRCERLFRCLYSKVRTKDQDIEPFFMGVTGDWFTELASRPGGDKVEPWWKTVLSATLVAFYGAILAAGLAICLWLR